MLEVDFTGFEEISGIQIEHWFKLWPEVAVGEDGAGDFCCGGSIGALRCRRCGSGGRERDERVPERVS